jgi:hypothetical protein
MRGRTAALLLALALAAAGCGGDGDGGSDEDDVKSAVSDYGKAVAESDQERACELLTESVKQEVEEETGKQCQSFVTNLASFGSAEEIAGAEASEVTVNGIEATATVKGVGGIELEMDLAKEGDDWKIADPDDADLGAEITP